MSEANVFAGSLSAGTLGDFQTLLGLQEEQGTSLATAVQALPAGALKSASESTSLFAVLLSAAFAASPTDEALEGVVKAWIEQLSVIPATAGPVRLQALVALINTLPQAPYAAQQAVTALVSFAVTSRATADLEAIRPLFASPLFLQQASSDSSLLTNAVDLLVAHQDYRTALELLDRVPPTTPTLSATQARLALALPTSFSLSPTALAALPAGSEANALRALAGEGDISAFTFDNALFEGSGVELDRSLLERKLTAVRTAEALRELVGRQASYSELATLFRLGSGLDQDALSRQVERRVTDGQCSASLELIFAAVRFKLITARLSQPDQRVTVLSAALPTSSADRAAQIALVTARLGAWLKELESVRASISTIAVA